MDGWNFSKFSDIWSSFQVSSSEPLMMTMQAEIITNGLLDLCSQSCKQTWKPQISFFRAFNTWSRLRNVVASLQNPPLSRPCQWFLSPGICDVVESLPRLSQDGLCHPQNKVEGMVCGFWSYIIKGTVASASIFWKKCSGGSQFLRHEDIQTALWRGSPNGELSPPTNSQHQLASGVSERAALEMTLQF